MANISSERLKNERVRIGFTQEELGNKCGVTKLAQFNYEKGTRFPTSEYLEKAAQLGVDVQYVITGTPSHSNINAEEAFLLQQFRQLTVDQKKMMLSFLLGGFTGMNQPAQATPMIGGNNTGSLIIGDKGTINNIKTEKHIIRTKAEVKPNETHISQEMARKIKDLVDEIVALEPKVRKNPRPYSGVWAALNKHCGVTTYKLIPLDHYTKAETYLRKWIGRLQSTKSAPKKMGSDYRNKKYAYIKLNTEQLGIEGWLDELLRVKYGVTSLKDLTDEELQKVYDSVSSKKASAKRKHKISTLY